ncbi:hypothetical protein HHK36_011162 [Tetracentron sinense]|uniref:RRM domain-containing protein n=1 Tax=Tetracentron sinense TaxID=13715 RepID=A0A835DFY3_TETSI|nr:hypothetical protein HHK36_011162 [Tetracentron sinense]
MASFVTLEELKSFHSIDREIFSRLVLTLQRDLGESMQVIGLWLWLEEAGYDNLVNKMLPLPDALVNALADEAVTCLACIETGQLLSPYENYDIALTHSLMQKEISIQFFHDNRISALGGVTKFVNDVCTRAFSDIVQQALYFEGNAAQSTAPQYRQRPMVTGEGSSSASNVRAQVMLPSGLVPLVHPGYSLPFFSGRIVPPHMVAVGANIPQVSPSLDPLGTAISNQQPNLEGILSEEFSSRVNLDSRPPSLSDEVPQEQRTIFLTFSKGYPISEGEVMRFFTRKYGDCIETIYMQEVDENVQALYARLVIREASTIATILKGKDKVKFVINGKHVWARRYVPKKQRS